MIEVPTAAGLIRHMERQYDEILSLRRENALLLSMLQSTWGLSQVERRESAKLPSEGPIPSDPSCSHCDRDYDHGHSWGPDGMTTWRYDY